MSTVKRDTYEVLGVRLLTKDPLEGDTLFDGIDFGALDYDGDGQLTLAEEGSPETTTSHFDAGTLADAGLLEATDAATAPDAGPPDDDAKQHLDAAYHRLKRTFQTHDHFDIKPKLLSHE